MNCGAMGISNSGVPGERKPKLDERFITTIEGKDFVYYAGLLDLAHQKSPVKPEVETLYLPLKDNVTTAICRATAQTSLGGSFSPNMQTFNLPLVM